MDLTPLQKRWLRTRGGRSIGDVLYTKLGTPYVLMSAGRGCEPEKVFLPDDAAIKAEIEIHIETYAR